ncbi:flagellar basal body P-ring formation chaperone FlgA [Scleromatobacter humisilvae]|uniref:Flagella basal body P-ring formation protein FlgA n=1 Tax=Scleromatobacter humisilvae TaxID=2897159 RepID=A0A9X2C0C4_9BURK|nr:flagellar basal body P-ring formation chaperone FlgA [Scleromatobacter humisilvae]MCK9684604.1 flagellar basal body P-ring formation chaperone FlgA [Scleromatobacter humisilvae]
MNAFPATAALAARRLAALAVLAAAGAPALAQDEPGYTPDNTLLQQVETMARNGASAATAQQGQGLRVEVKVGKLDPRLKLAPCQHIDTYLPPGLPVWGATRIGMRCTQGAKLWNVSIPIQVSVYAQATVLKAALPAGTVLDASQLAQAEVDIAAAPGAAVPDPLLVVGRTLGRGVAAGATLRQTDLKARQFFAAGETVRVTAIGKGWSVETEGQAIGPGIEGQNVNVRTEAGRLLSARPTGQGQVEVTL